MTKTKTILFIPLLPIKKSVLPSGLSGRDPILPDSSGCPGAVPLFSGGFGRYLAPKTSPQPDPPGKAAPAKKRRSFGRAEGGF